MDLGEVDHMALPELNFVGDANLVIKGGLRRLIYFSLSYFPYP